MYFSDLFSDSKTFSFCKNLYLLTLKEEAGETLTKSTPTDKTSKQNKKLHFHCNENNNFE